MSNVKVCRGVIASITTLAECGCHVYTCECGRETVEHYRWCRQPRSITPATMTVASFAVQE